MAKKTSNMATHSDSKHNAVDKERIGLDRLVFFSDAVFAISITLLVLEIRLPAIERPVTSEALLKSLLVLWPKYISYIISFLVIGIFWIAHHRRFRFIVRYDNTLLSLNLLLLMAIAFSPFPTSIIGEYKNQTATIFYALTMTLTSLLAAVIWWYASHNNRLIDVSLDPRQRRRETWRSLLLPVIFLGSIGLSFISDSLAKLSWLLAAIAAHLIR
jgi:uncharacterized membrane protein